MYVHFSFENGSNPYIATTMENTFRMIVKYSCDFASSYYSAGRFIVCEKERNWKRKRRSDYKAILQNLAIDWSHKKHEVENLETLNYWSEFFYQYGKRYGLLKEFHENCIC